MSCKDKVLYALGLAEVVLVLGFGLVVLNDFVGFVSVLFRRVGAQLTHG